MPRPEPMSPAEFLVITEHLGLRQSDVARILGIEERSVRRWIAGERRVPQFAVTKLEEIEAATAAGIGEYVTALNDAADVGVVVYRTDEDMWNERPDLKPYPARWHRALLARVAHEIPGLEFTYATPTNTERS